MGCVKFLVTVLLVVKSVNCNQTSESAATTEGKPVNQQTQSSILCLFSQNLCLINYLQWNISNMLKFTLKHIWLLFVIWVVWNIYVSCSADYISVYQYWWREGILSSDYSTNYSVKGLFVNLTMFLDLNLYVLLQNY